MVETLPRTAPRKRDAEATRAAILAAAKTQFARFGYDSTALRSIAGEAGVDVALVKRYFGGKEGLFSAALRASFDRNRLLEWNRETVARDIAVMMADNASSDDPRVQSFQFLLQAATSPSTRTLLSAAVQERFLGPIREWLGGADAEARARVLAAAYIGFLVERLIRVEPLRGEERAAFIKHATATFETILKV